MTPQGLTILGATGTIGVNTLDVVSRHPQQFRVVALTGQSQLDKLAEQCRRFAPRYAVVLDAASASTLSGLLAAAGCDTEVLYGAEALAQVATLRRPAGRTACWPRRRPAPRRSGGQSGGIAQPACPVAIGR
jgi:1-deoxy-D-xylulose-5-phosphate reductoisomerase